MCVRVCVYIYVYEYIHIYAHPGILFRPKKECNLAICKIMDGPWRHYAKWSKSDKDKYRMISPICGKYRGGLMVMEKSKIKKKTNKQKTKLNAPPPHTQNWAFEYRDRLVVTRGGGGQNMTKGLVSTNS